jgi:hypothetical protein
MRRLLVVAVLMLLSGCAWFHPSPRSPRATKPVTVSRSDLPRIVYRVVLIAPQGLGTIELREEPEAQGRAEVAAYRAYGGILASDDVGRWRFTYIKTSLEGPGVAPGEWVDGLHAVSVILANGTRGDLEIDWERSAFVDASGRSQRVIHRGIQLNQRSAQMLPSTVAAGGTLNEFVFPGDGITFNVPGRASVWNSPAVLERLTPGAEFSIVLNIKSGTAAAAPHTFKFSVVPAPAAMPAPTEAPPAGTPGPSGSAPPAARPAGAK